MTSTVYLVANHSVEQTAALATRKWELTNVLLVTQPLLTLDRIPHAVVFFSVADFLRNRQLVNAVVGHHCFVHGSVVKLLELVGGYPLDYTVDNSLPTLDYQLLPKFLPMRGCQARPVEVVVIDHVEKLAALLKTDSILQTFMTLVYAVRREHQHTLKTQLLTSLLDPDFGANLENNLAQLTISVGLEPRLVISMRELLTTPLVQQYNLALLEFVTTNSSVEQVCAKYHVSPYEIRYVLSLAKVKFE